MAEIQKIKEGMTGQQVADLLDSNFKALNEEIGSGGGGITVDDSLSDSSTNPVQNKVIKAELDKKAAKTDVNTAINKVKSELNSDIEGNSSDISDLQSSVGTLSVKVSALSGIDSPFVGYFDSAGKLPARTESAWALAGDLATAKPYAYYVAGNVPSGYAEGWNDLSGVLGTYDFTEVNVISYKITNFEKINNFYYSLLQDIPVYNQYYFYSEIAIPNGAVSVKMKHLKSTGGGLGVLFKDRSNNKISTFSNTTLVNGTEIEVDIPDSAKSFIFSYQNGTLSGEELAPSFEGFEFKISVSKSLLELDKAIYGEIRILDGNSIKRDDGRYYNIKDNAFVEAYNLFTSEIKIPDTYNYIELSMVKSTGGGTGITFKKGEKILKSYTNADKPVGTLLKFPIPIGATEVLFSYYNDEYCINQSYPLFSCIIFSIGGILPEMDKEEIQIVSPVINIMPLPTYGGADLYLSPGTGNDLLDGLRLEELYANYDELCTKYPMWIRRVENLGSDSSGLEIRQYEVRYTNPWVVNGEGGMIGKGNEVNLWNDASYGYQKILINTGTHGDEKSPCWGTMLAIKDIVESSESWAMFIKSSFIIKVCPTLNPYGFQNRTLANYNGVNINRDIAALTQPESQAWKAWVDANTDAKAYLDMHGVDFYHPFFEIAKSNTDELKKLYGGLAAKFAAAFLENWSSYLGNSDYPRPYTVISTYNGTTMEYIASIGIKGFTVETPCDIVSNQYNPAPNYFKNYSKSNKITKDMLINLIMFLGKLS